MRYKIKKETKPNLPTFGKYKAVAVHNQVIESRQLYDVNQRKMSNYLEFQNKVCIFAAD